VAAATAQVAMEVVDAAGEAMVEVAVVEEMLVETVEAAARVAGMVEEG
jgi:hypothetical protein